MAFLPGNPAGLLGCIFAGSFLQQGIYGQERSVLTPHHVSGKRYSYLYVLVPMNIPSMIIPSCCAAYINDMSTSTNPAKMRLYFGYIFGRTCVFSSVDVWLEGKITLLP